MEAEVPSNILISDDENDVLLQINHLKELIVQHNKEFPSELISNMCSYLVTKASSSKIKCAIVSFLQDVIVNDPPLFHDYASSILFHFNNAFENDQISVMKQWISFLYAISSSLFEFLFCECDIEYETSYSALSDMIEVSWKRYMTAVDHDGIKSLIIRLVHQVILILTEGDVRSATFLNSRAFLFLFSLMIILFSRLMF
jgi:hypothetical protein